MRSAEIAGEFDASAERGDFDFRALIWLLPLPALLEMGAGFFGRSMGRSWDASPKADLLGGAPRWMKVLDRIVGPFTDRFDGGFDNEHDTSIILLLVMTAMMVLGGAYLWSKRGTGAWWTGAGLAYVSLYVVLVLFICAVSFDGAVRSFLCHCIV